MAQKLVHKRSNQALKAPTGATLDYGEIAVNYNVESPFLSIKNSDNTYSKFSSDDIIAAGMVEYVTGELKGYSVTGHTHDDRYYTETEVDAKIKAVNDTIEDNELTTSAALNELNERVLGTAPAIHTHKKSDITDFEHTHGTVTLTGDVTGSASFTNAGATIDATVANDSHTHGSTSITGKITAGTGITDGATGLVDGNAVYEYAQPKGNYKTIQTAVSSPSASGNATAFIDTITQNTNGVISVTKKNVDFSAYVNQNAFSNVKVGTTTVAADSATDTLTLVAGTNVQISADTNNDTITISASHSHNYAGSSSAGGAATSANKLNTDAGLATQPVYFSNGVPVACSYTLGKSVPSDAVFTDTHHQAKNIVGASSGATANAAATNGNVWLNLIENSAVRSRHNIKGAGATTVTSDSAGTITITSTDTNTWRPVYNGVDSTDTSSAATANAVKTAYDKAVSAYNLANGKTSNVGTVTSVKVTGGTGLSGGGTVTSSGTITLNHAAAYTGTSLTKSTSGANYYLTGVTLTMDGLGHVTGISGGEAYDDDANTNYYLTGVSGSGNGTVTFTRQGLGSLTWDASHTHSEYSGTGHTHSYLSLSGGEMLNQNLVKNLNADLLDGYSGSAYSKTGHTHSNYVSTAGGSVVAGTTNFNKIQISGAGTTYGTGATLFFGDSETEVYLRNTADKDLTIYASGTLNLNGGSVLINGYTPSRITGATGTVSNTTGTPSVSIATGGTASAQTLSFTFTNIKGAKGDKGDKGDTGSPGTNGTNGTNGTDGADGRSVGSLVCVGGSTSTATTTPSTANDGTSYYRIKDTAGNWLSGYIAVKNGSKGSNGTNGTNGTNGSDGSDGADGYSIYYANATTQTTTTTISKSYITTNSRTPQIGDFILSYSGYLYKITSGWTTSTSYAYVSYLTTLKGSNGSNGSPGTNGTNGANGADGLSMFYCSYAYSSGQTSISRSYLTPSATVKTPIKGDLVITSGGLLFSVTSVSASSLGVSYLTSLKGDKGDKGDTGSPGTNGTNGTNGKSVTQVVCTSSLTSTTAATVNTADGATNYYRFKDSSGGFITGGIIVKNGSKGSTTTTTTTDEKVKSEVGVSTKTYLLGTTASGTATGTAYKSNAVYMSGSSTTNTTLFTPRISATTITASTAFYQSDERLKDFCGEIDVDFEKLKGIPKKYYTWKSDENKELQIGTSAQKVLEVYPELVGGSEDTNYAVDYARLSIVALKAIDKLHDENQTLRDLVEKMDKRITELEEKLK